MAEIDVDNLMGEIDAAALLAGPEPAFPQLELQQVLPELREYHAVEPRPPLIGRTRYERLWVRINGVLRRGAAHAVEPAVAQQNESNAALLAALEELVRSDAALRAAVVALRAAEHTPPSAADGS
jgi:hypothetical protein